MYKYAKDDLAKTAETRVLWTFYLDHNSVLNKPRSNIARHIKYRSISVVYDMHRADRAVHRSRIARSRWGGFVGHIFEGSLKCCQPEITLLSMFISSRVGSGTTSD